MTWLRDGRLCVVSGHGVSNATLMALASWDGHGAAPERAERAARARRIERAERQRRPGPAHALLERQRRERVGQPTRARRATRSSKSSSSAGISTKRRVEQLLVRQRHALVRELQLAEQQDVDVDRARTVAHARRAPAELALESP